MQTSNYERILPTLTQNVHWTANIEYTKGNLKPMHFYTSLYLIQTIKCIFLARSTSVFNFSNTIIKPVFFLKSQTAYFFRV